MCAAKNDKFRTNHTFHVKIVVNKLIVCYNIFKNCNKKFIIDAIEAGARGIAQGVTSALANANA